MSAPDPRAGFTLLEVLAALAITVALASIALPFASGLMAHWSVGERQVSIADGWMQGVARLSDDLAEAVPVVMPGAKTPVVAFTGGVDFVQFVRPTLGHATSTDLETVRYEIRRGATGDLLVRRAMAFSRGDVFAAGARQAETVILEGGFRLTFAILGTDSVPLRVWSAETQMPKGVALTIGAPPSEIVPPAPIIMAVVSRAADIPGSAKQAATGNAPSDPMAP